MPIAMPIPDVDLPVHNRECDLPHTSLFRRRAQSPTDGRVAVGMMNRVPRSRGPYCAAPLFRPPPRQTGLETGDIGFQAGGQRLLALLGSQYQGPAGRVGRLAKLARLAWAAESDRSTSGDWPPLSRSACRAKFRRRWAIAEPRVRAGRQHLGQTAQGIQVVGLELENRLPLGDCLADVATRKCAVTRLNRACNMSGESLRICRYCAIAASHLPWPARTRPSCPRACIRFGSTAIARR